MPQCDASEQLGANAVAADIVKPAPARESDKLTILGLSIDSRLIIYILLFALVMSNFLWMICAITGGGQPAPVASPTAPLQMAVSAFDSKTNPVQEYKHSPISPEMAIY